MMNKREKKLLGVFVSLIVLVGVSILLKKYFEEINYLKSTYEESSIKASRYEQSVKQATVIKDEKGWLTKHESAPKEYSKAMTRFQSFITESAKMNGLSYTSSTPEEVEDAGGYYRTIQSRVNNIRGTQKQLTTWLCELHKPSEFRAVTSLTIIPDEEDSNLVVCNLTVDLFLVELKVSE